VLRACGPEIAHFLATAAVLPPAVVTSLSPELAHIIHASVSYNHTLQNRWCQQSRWETQ
jgi:hypothetical protein